VVASKTTPRERRFDGLEIGRWVLIEARTTKEAALISAGVVPPESIAAVIDVLPGRTVEMTLKNNDGGGGNGL
jgi:hypothetical protein